ncbi:MAG: SpoIIE family protein phosphatase [Verrucomicrobiota bacterium]|nr:SpoIIE family protein phosphatase [Verrucomicrobiota bacterium]
MIGNPQKVAPDILNQVTWERDAYRGLVEISGIINSEENFETLLQKVLDIAKKVIGAEASTLWLEDSEGGGLIMRATSVQKTITGQVGVLRIPKGKGVSGWSYEHHQSVLVKDCQNDPRFYKDADKKTGFVTRSLLTAPLISHGKCIGVIQALNPGEKDFFDEYELPVFEGYAKIVATAIENARLKEAEMSNLRTQQELQVASDIQANFLPDKLYSGAFCEVAVLYESARAVGGDFYDFFEINEDVICAVIGDVSGKGVPASLLMAQTLTQIRMLSRYCKTPQEVLESTNEAFSEQRTNGLFVTAICAFYHRALNQITLANAGHHDPLLVTSETATLVKTESGIPLGVLSGSVYPQTTVTIRPGESLIFYSDGLPESRNEQSEEFGLEKIMGLLPDKAFCAKAMIDLIDKELKRFSGKAPQHDDLTVFITRANETLEKGRRFAVPCEPAQFAGIREFVRRSAACAGFDEMAVGQIVLALDEAVTNVYRHGYGECDGNEIRLFIHKEGDSCFFEIEDDATCVDPAKFKSRDIDDIRPGGLGVYLITSVMDEVQLVQSGENNGNRLIMKKRVSGGE